MPPKILIVDDQPVVLDVLKKTLSRGPYTVKCAQSALEALQLMENEQVDVVISDERMPGMPGSEFLALVRQQFPKTVRIILTGHASLESAIRAINEGEIYRFLTKPCNYHELLDTVQSALAHRAKNMQAEQLDTSLEALEKEAPGITRVKRDAQEMVIIDPDE